MSILSLPFFKSRAPRQVVSDLWEKRHAITEPDVNLFSWARPGHPEVHHYLSKIIAIKPQSIRCKVDQDHLESQLELVRSDWDIDRDSGCSLFWEDLERIVYDFLGFAESSSGTMHLKIIEDDACTKFHIDGYRLRLFCTYLGQGTEWLPEHAVNRSALGKENKRIVRDQNKIQQVGTGHVTILKGQLPNQRHGLKGIVHRSPRISHTGEKRIILRVDI